MTLDSGQAAFLILVRRFVERQKLVYQVMEEIRPDKLMFVRMYEQHQGKPTEEDFSAYSEYAKWFVETPQGGWWGEWVYFFHGAGCRLMNILTGEPIDWEAPDVDRFDRFFFSDYLKWAFKRNAADPVVAEVHARYLLNNGKVKHFVHTQLEHLASAGYLSKDDADISYRLLS